MKNSNLCLQLGNNKSAIVELLRVTPEGYRLKVSTAFSCYFVAYYQKSELKIGTFFPQES